MLTMHGILCPTDFSEFSERALRYACELADKFHAELHLLHVLQDYDAVALVLNQAMFSRRVQ